jgi:hypothetical protein
MSKPLPFNSPLELTYPSAATFPEVSIEATATPLCAIPKEFPKRYALELISPCATILVYE